MSKVDKLINQLKNLKHDVPPIIVVGSTLYYGYSTYKYNDMESAVKAGIDKATSDDVPVITVDLKRLEGVIL